MEDAKKLEEFQQKIDAEIKTKYAMSGIFTFISLIPIASDPTTNMNNPVAYLGIGPNRIR